MKYFLAAFLMGIIGWKEKNMWIKGIFSFLFVFFMLMEGYYFYQGWKISQFVDSSTGAGVTAQYIKDDSTIGTIGYMNVTDTEIADYVVNERSDYAIIGALTKFFVAFSFVLSIYIIIQYLAIAAKAAGVRLL